MPYRSKDLFPSKITLPVGSVIEVVLPEDEFRRKVVVKRWRISMGASGPSIEPVWPRLGNVVDATLSALGSNQGLNTLLDYAMRIARLRYEDFEVDGSDDVKSRLIQIFTWMGYE